MTTIPTSLTTQCRWTLSFVSSSRIASTSNGTPCSRITLFKRVQNPISAHHPARCVPLRVGFISTVTCAIGKAFETAIAFLRIIPIAISTLCCTNNVRPVKSESTEVQKAISTMTTIPTFQTTQCRWTLSFISASTCTIGLAAKTNTVTFL